MSEIILFSGSASSFKGGRNYVHATDTLAFVDSCAATYSANLTVAKIEFLRPLTTRGVLVIDPRPNQVENNQLHAKGVLGQFGEAKVPFIVFASPISVDLTQRAFDEKSIWADASFSVGGDSVTVERKIELTTAEHLSSLMKLLCQTLLSEHKKWWFVRLQKEEMLPEMFSNVEIKRKRIIAKKLVSAVISFDGKFYGEIDFVGAGR